MRENCSRNEFRSYKGHDGVCLLLWTAGDNRAWCRTGPGQGVSALARRVRASFRTSMLVAKEMRT